MPTNLTYLLINIGAVIVPFIFSFHPKIKFHKQWYAFLPANLIITIVFIAWDILYTKIGVWGFSDRYTLGIKLFNLPLEEVLFFICIPYASVFTYFCFKSFYPKLKTVSSGLISSLLVIFLIITGFLNASKLYTGVTFLALALVIINHAFLQKKVWLSVFYFTFLVILIPFFIVNGILTGTGLDEPVVWYDDSQNLKIRLLTIPLEDVFYGMLLLVLNVSLFEFFINRNIEKKNTHISV